MCKRVIGHPPCAHNISSLKSHAQNRADQRLGLNKNQPRNARNQHGNCVEYGILAPIRHHKVTRLSNSFPSQPLWRFESGFPCGFLHPTSKAGDMESKTAQKHQMAQDGEVLMGSLFFSLTSGRSSLDASTIYNALNSPCKQQISADTILDTQKLYPSWIFGTKFDAEHVERFRFTRPLALFRKSGCTLEQAYSSLLPVLLPHTDTSGLPVLASLSGLCASELTSVLHSFGEYLQTYSSL